MSENKKIIKLCPNFYKIINFNPIIEDDFSNRLIDIYQNYIFKIDVLNESEVNKVKELDAAIAKYIDDYQFRKEVQKLVKKNNNNVSDFIKYVIDTIIHLFTNYEEYTTRVIYISRWI